MAVDSPFGPSLLVHAMRASGRQYAVACGALVALLSLFNDTPVRIASLRGVLTWGALLLVVSAGIWFAERAWPQPAPAPDRSTDEEEGTAAAASEA
ncbi:MAG: hypothetical protein VX460_03650 [Planctomycetota bacterium]|nr:hypothetical protein [Planctomycetota bacterium]